MTRIVSPAPQFTGYKPNLAHAFIRPSRPTNRAELYAYYKSMGMLDVYFALFPPR
jgi:hypothetical protein